MPADKWIETYRGTVFRWEVDDNDHFTVAYYLARIGDASVAMLHALGTVRPPTVDCFIRYQRELRTGDIMHIDSAVIAVDADGARARPQAVRLGRRRAVHHGRAAHRRLRSSRGQAGRWRRAASPGTARPATSARGPPASTGFRDSSRDTVKPGRSTHRASVASRRSSTASRRPTPTCSPPSASRRRTCARIAPRLLHLRVPARLRARCRRAIRWSCAARWSTSATPRSASSTPCSTSAAAPRWGQPGAVGRALRPGPAPPRPAPRRALAPAPWPSSSAPRSHRPASTLLRSGGRGLYCPSPDLPRWRRR